jgi:predicted alpha/beta hydrolase family esterase
MEVWNDMRMARVHGQSRLRSYAVGADVDDTTFIGHASGGRCWSQWCVAMATHLVAGLTCVAPCAATRRSLCRACCAMVVCWYPHATRSAVVWTHAAFDRILVVEE